MITLEELDTQNLYQGYTYSYPHKLAYRSLSPMGLQDVWREEDMDQLFLYAHIPFCEMRCGFCNLFTIANPKEGIDAYLRTLQRQVETYQQFFPKTRFTSFAIGGGTPTFLDTPELEHLFGCMTQLGLDMSAYYGSIEASPKTLTKEKIQLIADSGITRLSMGVQSWIEEETKALGRPQSVESAEAAVAQIALSSIPEYNLDLIYGASNQTVDSFLYSVEKTLSYEPTEIFLYPLYVRHLTGLEKRRRIAEDHRHTLYLAGRDTLVNAGYEQVSMRCFRKADTPPKTTKGSYDPLTHGMIGIGAGARSYTRQMHYSTDYAVGRKAIKDIIANYVDTNDFGKISYGIQLTVMEQKRRFLIKSLTDGGRLCHHKYKVRFGSDAFDDFELLPVLIEKQWLEEKDDTFQLTQEGMSYEDVIGPAFYSDAVKSLMKSYTWK